MEDLWGFLIGTIQLFCINVDGPFQIFTNTIDFKIFLSEML